MRGRRKTISRSDLELFLCDMSDEASICDENSGNILKDSLKTNEKLLLATQKSASTGNINNLPTNTDSSNIDSCGNIRDGCKVKPVLQVINKPPKEEQAEFVREYCRVSRVSILP